MVRQFKTGKKNRTTYKYYIDNKVVAEITPNDEKTKLEIAFLHQKDDEEVDANRREKYKAPYRLDGFYSIDDDAEDINPYFADNTYNPHKIMLDAFEQEERIAKSSKIREVFDSLDPKLKSIATKVYIENRTRVDVAKEEGVSEAMIRKHLSKVRDIFEKEFKEK